MGAFDDIPTVKESGDPFADLPTVEKSSPKLKGSATAGAIEAALGIGSNIAGNVAGLGYAIGTGDAGVMEPIAESMTYEPRTQRGQDIQKIITEPFNQWDKVAEWLGEQNRETGKSPLYGAVVKTIVDALPMLVGARRGGAATETAERPAPRPEAQPAPALPAARPFPIPPAEKPVVARPNAELRAEPVPETFEDPFADLPNAGNLDDVKALQPKETSVETPTKPAGYWEGPGGTADVIETSEVPGLAERAKELLFNDRRWKSVPVENERRGARPALELESETPEQLRAKDAAAEAGKRQEARAAAAPPAEEFTLSGSDRPADQAAARGQMELTEAPFEDLPEVEPAPAEDAKPKRLKRASANPESLLTKIKRMGGIDLKEILDLTGENKRMVRPGLFSRSGNALDDLATRLRDEGFDIPQDSADGGVQALRNMIQDEVTGRKKHYSFADQEAVFERERNRITRESVEESTIGEDSLLTDEEALKAYGPGTLGMNAALDPRLIKEGWRALGDTAHEALTSALGVPGKDRNIFSPILREEQYRVAQADRWAAGEGHTIREAFQKPAERDALTLAIVRGDLSGYKGAQLAAAQKLKKNYQQVGEYLLETRQIAGLRTNYSPQIWDIRDSRTRRMIEMWREARDKGPIREASPLVSDRVTSGKFSPFLLERAIENVEEGMKLGLKPVSLDAAALFETYIRSTVRAVERGKAFKSLGELMSDDGVPVQMPTKQAPRDYVSIRNPEFEGYRFHPDAAPAIKVAYETDNPWLISKALQMAAYAAKRGAVSYSGFHPMSLAMAWEGTMPGMKGFNPKGAIDAALKRYREGGPGDTVDKLLREGLKIGVPMEDLIGRERFTTILDRVESVLDKTGAGAITRIPRKIDRALQYATWDYLQTGFKLDIGIRLAELKIAQNAEKIARGEITEQSIYRQVAESVNGFQGGVNWERMIEKFDTPVGRKIMQEVLSKSGRRWMQTYMFAPDWLVSTVSTWTNVATGGEAASIRRQLARRYLLTSAIITYTYGNALNYYFTGHSMFENKSNKKDPTPLDNLKAKTEIQLKDGRHINPNKHFLEVPHAALAPIDFALNKMNPVASEPIEQIANKQYLTTGYSPAITDRRDSQMKALKKRAAHAAEKVLPITGRSIMQQGVAGLGGFFGFPVSGMTEEQKRQQANQRDIDRAMGR